MTQHLDHTDLELDEPRLVSARTASHGFGAGQIEARQLIAQWPADESAQRAADILNHVELAQDYAQAAPSLFDEYVGQLRAADPSDDPLTRDRQNTLAGIYQAGFDIGFTAALVEGSNVMLGRRAPETADRVEQAPDDVDTAYVNWS